DIDVYASDDGINATEKSSAYSLMIEVNGGTIYVQVGPGDTDGFDSNGDIYINGGTTDVIAPFSAFDCNGNAAINGGTVRVNGQVIHEITCEGGPPPH
ncbi:MAG TPA: carbohydrate-binding domain-containing protein, partial [bacterium]|nr:carbohydrate-binding domain-containing protein [bacterium]